MTDNINNQFNSNSTSSNQSQSTSNANTSNASGSQYKVVLDKDPTKLKLKLIPALSTLHLTSSTDHSLSHVPDTSQYTDGNTNKIVNGAPSSTTSMLLSNQQIPVSSRASHFGNNNTASASTSTFSWHTPTPLPATYNPHNAASSAAAGPSSSTSSLSSSSSSSPASARSSSPGMQRIANNISITLNTINNQRQTSTVAPVYSSPMPSQIPASSLASFYSGYNPNQTPAHSYSTMSQANNLLHPVISPFDISQHGRITSTVPPAIPPAINSTINSMIPPTTIPYPMAAPKDLSQPSVLKRKAATMVKSNAKQPRGRPKKSSKLSSLDVLNWIQTSSTSLPTSSAHVTNVARAQTTYTLGQLANLPTARPIQQFSPYPHLSPALEKVQSMQSMHPAMIPFVRPPVTAIPPMPPNWLENCEDTIMSLYPLKKYKVNPSSMEYETITKMLYPVVVKEVEKVVNPDLWKRFVNTRKEMIRSKTDDLNILPKLGLDELEVLRCAHLALNYNKDPLLIPYSDNMVLLFHCTRNKTNLDNILSQGLDERLSSISGGLLGKGIYFADDPQKSIQYDGTGCVLIFAVLLGDCISVDHFPNKNGLVREPEKVTQQKRNFSDHFFDSIVARPAGHNEYVIYNRYQCCPLYQIEYDRPGHGNPPQTNFNYATQKLPPIAWLPEGPNYAMPVQKPLCHWPFFAVDLFQEMGVTPPTAEDNTETEFNNAPAETNTPQMSIDEKLATLLTLGYYDVEKNKETLSKFNNDLDRAVNYFLDNENVMDVVPEGDQSSTSADVIVLSPTKSISTRALTTAINAATSTTSSIPKSIPSTSRIPMPSTSKAAAKSFVTIDLIDDDSGCSDDEMMNKIATKPCKIEVDTPDTSTHLPEDLAEWALEYDPNYLSGESELKLSAPEMDECLICYNEYESFETSPSLWEELQCSHKLCLACYSNILTTRTTMSGVQHTFVKCPFCQGTTGAEVGTCPDMQMNVSTIGNSCESYEPTNSICINYTSVPQRFNRTAYLPNNAEGQEVLNLLRIAHDRRLCFTVGTSVTTGRENTIVWNIHHKTSLRGGVSSYGYPDPTYMERVKWELKAFGIE